MRFRELIAAALQAVGALAAVAGCQGSAKNAKAPGMTAHMDAGIEKTMEVYNEALDAGDIAAVLPLYTESGVFMAPNTPSWVGREAVAVAYGKVFTELKFDVKFHIIEIVQMSPDWAFVRTNSAGTTLHHSTGTSTSEANQELFILEKGIDSAWRIARYSFSPTKPPIL